MSKLQTWATRKYIALTHKDEEGQGLAEYGLILALIAVMCIGALTALQGGISSQLSSLGGTIAGA
jgi:pilus assembly protein Flp/PilA